MTFSIVTLKAFGDFVIACGSARAVQAGANRPQVVAGEYVRPLAAALGVESEVRFIGTQHGAPWTDVPAVFDVRKRGLPAAVRSLFELRAILGQLPPAWNLVFDHAGPRERLLCSHHPFHSLSKEMGNVYLAYRQFFTQQRLTVTPHTIARQFVPYNALLVPGARMRHRVLPPAVIEQACHTLRERGCAVTVVLLEGEDIPLPEKIRPVRLPRSFQNLVAVMRESDLVITADSLPAHLGEYLQIPQFTFIPTPKDYMLPQFAYEAKGWTTFDQTPYFSRWLDAALPTL